MSLAPDDRRWYRVLTSAQVSREGFSWDYDHDTQEYVARINGVEGRGGGLREAYAAMEEAEAD